MSIVLSQVAKLETDPLRKYVLMNILREVRVMELLPFENVSSLTNIAIKWEVLPDASFRSINEGYTESYGDTSQVWESVYGFGGDITYDRVLDKIKNLIQDPVQLQTDMKILAMALKFNDYLINGDHGSDPKGFEGLLKRVSNMPARQSVYFAGAAAAALDPTASVANGRAYFDALEQQHYKTNRGEHNAWFANEGMKWGPGRVARYIQYSGGNVLDVTKDNFDREMPTLWGSPIIDIGMKRDQVTEIITETEIAGDAGADATSLYCAAFNNRDGVIGIQLSDMEVYDPLSGGELSTKPSKMKRIDWWLGLATFGSFGITRGRNVEGAGNWT